MSQEITAEESIQAARALFEPFLEAEGITPKYLAKRLKEELIYREPIERLSISDDGTKTFKTVKVKTPAAMRIRQQGRIDANKLRGDYPAEKKDLNFTGSYMAAVAAYLSGVKNENNPADPK